MKRQKQVIVREICSELRCAMREKGRVYRVHKKRSLQDEWYAECQFCGALIPWELVRFSSLGGEEMCPACKRREQERIRRRHA